MFIYVVSNHKVKILKPEIEFNETTDKRSDCKEIINVTDDFRPK